MFIGIIDILKDEKRRREEASDPLYPGHTLLCAVCGSLQGLGLNILHTALSPT